MLWASAASAPADSLVRAEARAVLHDASYQTTPPESLDKAAQASATLTLPTLSLPPWVFYSLLIVVGAVLVAYLARELGLVPHRGQRVVEGDTHTERERRLARPELQRAEALARAGAFADAIHELLLCALGEIDRRGEPLPVALTSREVLSRVHLTPDAELSFRHLVQAVERSHFGGHPVSREQFDLCRGQLDRLIATSGKR